MTAGGARGDPGPYPERDLAREPALDRAAGALLARLRAAFRRELRPDASLEGTVAGHAARFRASPLAAQLPELRYRLRRDGLSGGRLAECFGMYSATLPAAADAPRAPALGAAQALVRGAVVDLAADRDRRDALALAATAFALCGVPVHLYAASEAGAQNAARTLQAPLAALGLGAACITAGMDAGARRAAYGAAVACGTQRAIAFDYLRDRMRLGRRVRPLQGRLERLAGDAPAQAQLMLRGLHCALIEDADQVLLDDLRMPMVVSADAAASADRMLYEQALELARALVPEADFTVVEAAPRLTGRGSQRLGQLSVLLGGAWAARQGREDLVTAALAALHAMRRGRDYDVAQGALQLPAGPGQPQPPEALLRVLEVKEGLAFAGRQEVLARLSVPGFFRRYLRIAGVCGDARGLETEFWDHFRLRTARAGAPPAAARPSARVYGSPAGRRQALLQSVREHAARGLAVLVAVRDPTEAAALIAALHEGGLPPVLLRAGDPAAAQALAALDRPGAVGLSLYPAHRGISRLAREGVPLHLVVADLHEAGRQVAQIARAYAASSAEQFLDAEGAAPDEQTAERLQRAAERAAARERSELAAREQSMEELLAFSGRPE